MKVFVLVLTVAISIASALPQLEDVETEWKKFKQEHGKTYRSLLEENTRKSIFAQTYQKVLAHNELYTKGEKTYYLGINHLADLTRDEIKVRNGFKPVTAQKSEDQIERYIFAPNGADLPDSLDWRNSGAVQVVKNQGQCGSCWTFSVTGAVEAQYFFKTGYLPSLSEQNLVDCCKLDGIEKGCDGGWMTTGFSCIFVDDGIDSEEVYPYTSGDGTETGQCRYDISANVTSLRGFVEIEENNEDHLKAAVATSGPISISVEADLDDFAYYAGGVYYNPECTDSIDGVDHAVLVVGYGNENGEDYWLIKNSWGQDWGEQGFFKLARNRGNHCGVAAVASFPLMY